jgi:cysteinyl-tRNA synthetase
MLGLIQRLRRRPGLPGGNGDVNYAVRKFPYGKLSGKSLDELRAGERGGAGRQAIRWTSCCGRAPSPSRPR